MEFSQHFCLIPILFIVHSNNINYSNTTASTMKCQKQFLIFLFILRHDSKNIIYSETNVIYWNISAPKKNCRSIDVNTQSDKLRDRQWVIEIFFQAQFNYEFVLWAQISMFSAFREFRSNLSKLFPRYLTKNMFSINFLGRKRSPARIFETKHRRFGY